MRKATEVLKAIFTKVFAHMKKAADFMRMFMASHEIRTLYFRRITNSHALRPYMKWHSHMKNTSHRTGMGVVIPLFLCAVMITGAFIFRIYTENERLTKQVYVLASQVQNYSAVTTEQSVILDNLKDFESNAGKRIADFTEKYKTITETYFETRLGGQLAARSNGYPGQSFVSDISELQGMLNSLDALNKNTTNNDLKFNELEGQLSDYISHIPNMWPTYGNVTSFFGNRYTPFDYSYITHRGVDIPAPYGQNILASAAGVVTYAGWEGGYGITVVIDHLNGISTRYAHCSSLNVNSGQQVSKGDTIAYIGSTGDSTGSHLHFEVYVYGAAVDPLSFLQ